MSGPSNEDFERFERKMHKFYALANCKHLDQKDPDHGKVSDLIQSSATSGYKPDYNIGCKVKLEYLKRHDLLPNQIGKASVCNEKCPLYMPKLTSHHHNK